MVVLLQVDFHQFTVEIVGYDKVQVTLDRAMEGKMEGEKGQRGRKREEAERGRREGREERGRREEWSRKSKAMQEC